MSRHFHIMVTGSRDWPDKKILWTALDEIRARELLKDPDTFFVLLHGGARGADEMAGAWAQRRGISEEVMHARWRTEGKVAGLNRNRRMVATNPDVVLAFWHEASHGTGHAIGVARDAGIETHIHTSDGEHEVHGPGYEPDPSHG